MADALGLRVKQLFNDFRYASPNTFSESLETRIKVNRSFGDLTNHLKQMMLGYENEEVHSLVKKLVGIASTNDLYSSGHFKMDNILEIVDQLCTIRYGSNVGEEIVAGFDDDIETLLDQLTANSPKQLQVISIAGMAGLGKTTLATKLYMDPLVEYVFDIRAWICVSQVYRKRDLLLGILSSFINDLTDDIYEMRDEQLGEKLFRLLKGRKYLVVLDDIWDVMAWNDLQMYFPDDKTGSRILFTSRDIDLSLNVPAARSAHVLRLRTEDESWDIFQKKLFRLGICPNFLRQIGKVITKKCEGLPLAIVITAGLLKNERSYTKWSQISRSIRSYMVSDPSQYMDTLALSYNHLPPDLQKCFLFLGVYPEDCDIPATKLIWLWIAQGFIHETESRTLEDVAEDILMDLIKRSLLMIFSKRADNRVKSCRMHDLLRDLCLRKAEEEHFSPYRYVCAPDLAASRSITNIPPRMSLNTPTLITQSGLCYPFELGNILQEGGSIISETYASLRILDVESVAISLFPYDVIVLANLRYLAIQARDGSPKASISKLVNLQILIISSKKNIVLPKTIWNMVNLRHLYMKSGENFIDGPCFVQVTDNDACSGGLASLQTLSQVCPQSCQNIFSRTPNLRKLGFCGPLISSQGDLEFPNLRSLEHLQKLKLLNTNVYHEPSRSCNPILFPETLKQLTLSNTGMNWEEMWTFSLLPNLEVLKLKLHACIGESWEMGDAEFPRLKILKLHNMELRQWVCSRDNFPRLQRLMVHHCLKLHGIPADVGRILTLELIDVRGCSISTKASALQILQEQQSEGNFFLKVNAISKVNRNNYL